MTTAVPCVVFVVPWFWIWDRGFGWGPEAGT